MKIFTIPTLYCPFPILSSAFQTEIENHTNQWLLDFELVETSGNYIRYKEQRFAKMIAISYPLGKYADLAVWCDINTLLFIVDDMLDEQATVNSKQSYISFVAKLIAVLEENRSGTVESDGPVFAAWGDCWRRLVKRTPVKWQKEFIKEVRNTFEVGGTWAMDCLLTNRKPSLAEYLRLRQYLGAANLATMSLSVMANIDLPDIIYTHPTIERLTELCRNAICFSNDLFSLSKEKEYNADFNIVSILENERKMSIDQAIKEAAVIHNTTVRDFIKEGKKALQMSKGEIKEMLRKYLQALCCLMSGNVAWSTGNTTRYPHVYGYKAGNIQ